MNVITTAPADTSSSTTSSQPQRAKRLILGLVGSAVLLAGGITVTVVGQSHGPATAPAKAPAVRQAGLVRADRLQSQADALTAVGTAPLHQAAVTKADRLQRQADALTAVGTAPLQQPQTRLDHDLRNG